MPATMPGPRGPRFGLVFWLTVLLLAAADVSSLNTQERQGEAAARVAVTP